MKKYIDRGLMVIMVLLVLTALIGSVYMFQQTRLLERTVVNVYELNGEFYECKHTPGNMECWSINDPDVGFGRTQ